MKMLARLIILSVLVGTAALVHCFYQFYSVQGYTESKTIVIAPKTGTRAVLEQLHDAGLIPKPIQIALPLILTVDYHALKAGEYEFAPEMSANEIIAKIARGEVVVHKVTIPEGWTAYQVREAMMAEPLLTGELPRIEEGTLMPDTWHFQRGESRLVLVRRMQEAQTGILEKLWASRAEGCLMRHPMKR